MSLPSQGEIKNLHNKYAPDEESFGSVYTHSQIIHEIALELIDKSNLRIDKELIRVGAYLHDIGVYMLKKDDLYVKHGILGYELLKKEGYPEELCRFAAHHTGVGLFKEDIEKQGLPLPHRNFTADTEEEALIMYADKFHSKTSPPKFNKPESYKEYVSQFGPEYVKRYEKMVDKYGIPDLEKLSDRYDYPVK